MGENEIIPYKSGQLQKLKNVLAITNKILEVSNEHFHIVDLDWSSFSQAFLSMNLRKRIPDILIKKFRINELALNYIKDCFENKQKIDLVIVGSSNNKVDGISFAKAIIEMEISFSESFPIMFLAKQENIDFIRESEDVLLFDIIIPRSESFLEQVVDFLKSNVSGRSFSK